MIKRPLVWVLGAYIVGILFSANNISYLYIISFLLIACLVIYIMMMKIANPYINKKDSFLWFLPIMLLIGILAMKGQMERPELDRAFEDKVECRLNGQISLVVQKKWGRAIYVKNNMVYLNQGASYPCENVIVHCKDDKEYKIGNDITVYGEILKFSEPTNPGQFNEKNYYLFENIDYKMKADEIIISDYDYSVLKNVLYQFKERLINIYRSILPDKEAGTIIAMILGEKYLLDDDVYDLYKKNGVSHILSISGLHVSLIGMFLYKLLRKFNLPFNLVIIISIGFLYSYGILTNFSVSTVRAIIMMVLMLISGIFGKTYDMISAISLSALIILLANPFQLFQGGFLLSYGAVIGIAVLAPAFGKLLPSKSSTINGFFVSVSAQLITAPLILNFFYQLPLHSVFINMLIIPLSSALMLTSLIAGLIGLISPSLGILAIGGASYILKFYEWVCTWGEDIPGNILTVGIPNVVNVIVYVILILIFIWATNKYCKKRFLLILPLAFFILIFPGRYKGLEITMLDVGQGEAIYLRNDTGTTYLIDGGSLDVKDVGKYRITPFLLSKGIDHIDYVIVTHEDSDHTSGLMELISIGDIRINNLILPLIKEKGERYLILESLAKDNHIPIIYISTGDYIKDEELLLQCLNPHKDYEYSDPNSYSTVLSLSYGKLDMLFTGDIHGNGEKKIVDLIKDNPKIQTDYDILKVAHHGSKNSTSEEFLAIVKPELSLISCGKNSRYGHPHQELLDRLDLIGSQVQITYESGAITIRTDGKRMTVTRGRGNCHGVTGEW